MEVKIRYTVSDRKHSMILSKAELNKMKETGNMIVTQETLKGYKTLEIIGTDEEKMLFSEAILESLK